MVGKSLYGERERLAYGVRILDSLAGCTYMTKLAISDTLHIHARQLILASLIATMDALRNFLTTRSPYPSRRARPVRGHRECCTCLWTVSTATAPEA